MQIYRPALRLGRASEVEERLKWMLHLSHLALNHPQAVGRPPTGHVFQPNLYEHLNRGERIANLVSHSGGKLADSRELLGPKHFALALLEFLHDGLDSSCQVAHLFMQPA